MRIETTTRALYTFDELSEGAMITAFQELWDCNVDHEGWYSSVYADAESIGLKIKEFDLDYRANYLKGSWTMDGEDSAIAVLLNHGGDCDTAGIAYGYLHAVMGIMRDPAMHDDEATNGLSFEADKSLDVIEDEYRRNIEDEYLSMLAKEYEYLTSEELVRETILANGWEFTEDGKPAWRK